MGKWLPVEAYATPQPISETSTTQRLPLGTEVECKYVKDGTTSGFDSDYGISATIGPATFVYLKGVASTATGSWVTFDEAGLTTLTVADAKGPVAVAQSANVASQYGWYMRRGIAVAKVLASFAADKPIYLTSTAGSVDDAEVIKDQIHNAISMSAIDTPVTGYAYVRIDNPHCDDASELAA